MRLQKNFSTLSKPMKTHQTITIIADDNYFDKKRMDDLNKKLTKLKKQKGK